MKNTNLIDFYSIFTYLYQASHYEYRLVIIKVCNLRVFVLYTWFSFSLNNKVRICIDFLYANKWWFDFFYICFQIPTTLHSYHDAIATDLSMIKWTSQWADHASLSSFQLHLQILVMFTCSYFTIGHSQLEHSFQLNHEI